MEPRYDFSTKFVVSTFRRWMTWAVTRRGANQSDHIWHEAQYSNQRGSVWLAAFPVRARNFNTQWAPFYDMIVQRVLRTLRFCERLIRDERETSREAGVTVPRD